MKNKIVHCLTVLLMLYGLLQQTNAAAQNVSHTADLRKYTLAVQPFYLANLGLRFDLERRIGSTKRWLQIGPVGYFAAPRSGNEYGMLGTNGENFTRMIGGGLNLAYKQGFESNNAFYWQGGVSYDHYALRYKSYHWASFVEDGLTYSEYRQIEQWQNFNKLGANLLIGCQNSVQSAVFADFYFGLGYSYSFYNSDKAHFDDNMYGVGYRGLLFVVGLRFGLGFGKVKQ